MYKYKGPFSISFVPLKYNPQINITITLFKFILFCLFVRIIDKYNVDISLTVCGICFAFTLPTDEEFLSTIHVEE